MSMRMRIRQTRTSPGAVRHVRSTEDHGFTLIEVLVVITLMGISVVAVMAGTRATISATVIDRNRQLCRPLGDQCCLSCFPTSSPLVASLR